MSVRDLQDVFGFATPQAIYKWQQGVALPTIDNLVVLAAVLQVRLDDILVTDTAAQDVRGTSVLRPAPSTFRLRVREVYGATLLKWCAATHRRFKSFRKRS